MLTGKAQETFSAISVADSQNYFMVKAAVLRAYELVPEAYRQQFRKLRRSEGQIYVELVRGLTTHFNRWLLASEVNEMEDLKELVLLEHFKDILLDPVTTYLNEHQVRKVREAAVLADEYSLTHKMYDWGHREDLSSGSQFKNSILTQN